MNSFASQEPNYEFARLLGLSLQTSEAECLQATALREERAAAARAAAAAVVCDAVGGGAFLGLKGAIGLGEVTLWAIGT